jgi:hypothetical protein
VPGRGGSNRALPLTLSGPIIGPEGAEVQSDWRTTGAHPLICRAFVRHAGYQNLWPFT